MIFWLEDRAQIRRDGYNQKRQNAMIRTYINSA
jgi:hypothetical protein